MLVYDCSQGGGKTKPRHDKKLKREIGQHKRLTWSFGKMNVHQVVLEEMSNRKGKMIFAVSACPSTRDEVRRIVCEHLQDDGVRLVDHAFQPSH